MRNIRYILLCFSLLSILFFSSCNSLLEEDFNKNNTIIWWMMGEKPQDYNDVIKEINLYLNEKLNINLEIRYADEDSYEETIQNIILTGQNYDIAWGSGSINSFMLNVNNQSYIDITDDLNLYGDGLKKLIPESLWEGVTFNGKIYGIPSYKNLSENPKYIFSKEYVEKYNIDYLNIKSMEDLEVFLKTIKDNENVIPLNLTSKDGYKYIFDEFDMILETIPLGVLFNHGNPKDKTISILNPFETDIVMEKLDLIYKWNKLEYISSNFKEYKDIPSFSFLSMKDGYPYSDLDFESLHGYSVVSSPRYESYYSIKSSVSSVNAISANSNHIKESIQLLNLINTDTYLRTLISYGIEGKHYIREDNGLIKKLNTNYDGVDIDIHGSFFNLDIMKPAELSKWEDLSILNESSKKSPILGFWFDTSKLKTEIGVCTTIYNKYKSLILTGVEDPKIFIPQMIDDLNKGGYQKILLSAQEQLNKYIQNKD